MIWQTQYKVVFVPITSWTNLCSQQLISQRYPPSLLVGNTLYPSTSRPEAQSWHSCRLLRPFNYYPSACSKESGKGFIPLCQPVTPNFSPYSLFPTVTQSPFLPLNCPPEVLSLPRVSTFRHAVFRSENKYTLNYLACIIKSKWSNI